MNNNFILQSEEIRRLHRENKELMQKANKAKSEIEELMKKLQTKEDSASKRKQCASTSPLPSPTTEEK